MATSYRSPLNVTGCRGHSVQRSAKTVLTAPLIAEAYGVEVEIGVTPAGQRFILPIAR